MDSEILNKLYLKVLNFVSYSPRSKKEIEERLEKYIQSEKLLEDEAEEARDYVIETLTSQGYIDDEKIAKDLLFSYQNSRKPKSSKQIKMHLYKKKLSEELISRVVSQIDTESEFESALQILSKKAKNVNAPIGFLESQKLVKYLLSKGFDYSISKRAVDTLNEVK